MLGARHAAVDSGRYLAGHFVITVPPVLRCVGQVIRYFSHGWAEALARLLVPPPSRRLTLTTPTSSNLPSHFPTSIGCSRPTIAMKVKKSAKKQSAPVSITSPAPLTHYSSLNILFSRRTSRHSSNVYSQRPATTLPLSSNSFKYGAILVGISMPGYQS